MSEAQKRIAEVVAKHSGPYRTQEHPFDAMRLYTCNHGCDWHGPNTTAFANHVAAEIDKALGGLTWEEVEGMRVGDDPRLEPYREYRLVSGWIGVKGSLGSF